MDIVAVLDMHNSIFSPPQVRVIFVMGTGAGQDKSNWVFSPIPDVAASTHCAIAGMDRHNRSSSVGLGSCNCPIGYAGMCRGDASFRHIVVLTLEHAVPNAHGAVQVAWVE